MGHSIERFKVIEAIVKSQFNIVEVIGEDDSDFYIANTFEESNFNSTSSVDFNFITGININDFMISAVGFYGNPTQFNQRLSQYIESATVFSIKFSKYIKWKLYSSSK